MRSDMYKVIVERPRTGKFGYAKAKSRRDDIAGPTRLGMRAGYGCRGLNENLAPLRRFLQKQVGRPWNKVRGEISSGIDRRNAVQQHIHEHIDDLIATQCEWRNGKLVDLKRRWNRWYDELGQPLYVDPRTGLIRINEEYRSWAKKRREAGEREHAEATASDRKIGPFRHARLIDGQWYEVRIARLPDIECQKVLANDERRELRVDAPVFDVLEKKLIRRERGYGEARYYAASKRQLSKREIIEHGLRRCAS